MTATANRPSDPETATTSARRAARGRLPRGSITLGLSALLLIGASGEALSPGWSAEAEPAERVYSAAAGTPADRAVLVAGAVDVITPTVERDDTHDTAHVQIVDLTPDQQADVTRVISHYEAAGLELPPLTIRGSRRPGDCGDHFGVHRHDGGRSEIVLCSDPEPGWDRRVVGHELAHAWVEHNVTDDQRDEFQELRAWTHWRDYDVADWRDNGTEQAAEIISWAVHDTPTPLLIDVASCAELEQAFTALTDQTAPHGHTRFCDPAAAGERF